MRKFRGPCLYPGPDWNEPVSRFRPEFLQRECKHDARVRAWLASQPEALAGRVVRLEAALEALKKRPEPRPPNSKPGRQTAQRPGRFPDGIRGVEL